MQLVPAFGLGSPAAVEMGRCDRIYIDPFQWLLLDAGERRFILEHERAHCVHGIEDEAHADRMALDAITEAGIDPINAYEAITKTLDSSRPDHRERANAIQQAIHTMSAVPIDYTYNGNPFSPASGADPVNSQPGSRGSQPPARGNAIDWTDIINHGLDVAGEVTGDLLDGYLGNSSAPPPNYQTVPNKLPSWAYLAIGVGLLVVGYLLFKK